MPWFRLVAALGLGVAGAAVVGVLVETVRRWALRQTPGLEHIRDWRKGPAGRRPEGQE